MQKQGGVIHQRHQNNNKAGTSTSLLKSRCFDKSLNSASDPRAMGRFRVRVRQERMLRLSSGFCRSSPCNSPIPRHWPFLCYFHCCSQWDGAHSYPTPRLDPVPGSPAGCTSTGHHCGHHHKQHLPLVPPAQHSPCHMGKAALAPSEQLQLSMLPVSAGEPEPRNSRVVVSRWYDRSIFTHTRAHSVPLHITQSL